MRNASQLLLNGTYETYRTNRTYGYETRGQEDYDGMTPFPAHHAPRTTHYAFSAKNRKKSLKRFDRRENGVIVLSMTKYVSLVTNCHVLLGAHLQKEQR